MKQELALLDPWDMYEMWYCGPRGDLLLVSLDIWYLFRVEWRVEGVI